MVESQRKRYRLSYLAYAIFQPSKLKSSEEPFKTQTNPISIKNDFNLCGFFSKTREMRCLRIDFAENTLMNYTDTFAAKSHWISLHIFNIDFVISLGTNIFIWLQKLL